MGIGRLQAEGIPECIHSRDVIPQLDQQARLAWLTLQLADINKIEPKFEEFQDDSGNTVFFLSNQTNPIYLLLKKNCDTPSRWFS